MQDNKKPTLDLSGRASVFFEDTLTGILNLGIEGQVVSDRG